ncbi:hypothetical protein ACP70R_015159 [Stipagrostis hirtigluma subsp. patula]
MELSGRVVAAKRANLSPSDAGAAEDRLSALPDDVLVLILILLHLRTFAAARTSVLSRRWRRVWSLLPALRFPLAPSPPHRIRDALAASEVPLRYLLVGGHGASPESLAAWLPAAARRVSGEFALFNEAEEDEAAQGGAFELPCFEKAASTSGFSASPCSPPGYSPEAQHRRHSGARQSQHPFQVSAASGAQESAWLRQLAIVAPALEELRVTHCFLYDRNHPVADISAPQLNLLEWRELYDPSSVHLGKMEHLQQLSTFFAVYGHGGLTCNRACLGFMQRFKVLERLVLALIYMPELANYQYLMEDMTMLPDIKFLHLVVCANGHAFGASSFHVLRMCTGITRLLLELRYVEAQNECPLVCICYQPSKWQTEELLLNSLQEVEICDLRGSEHEVAVMKRLFSWATMLKRMTVAFEYSVTESKAKELFQIFRSFCRPGICMTFYIYTEL